MSITTFAQPGLLSPLHGLQGLFRWFSAAPVSTATSRANSRDGSIAVPAIQPNPVNPVAPVTPFEISGNAVSDCTILCATGQVSRPALRPGTRRVHTSRLVEAGQTSANVGRMVMSGRMEDVCAELDRLVLCEATLH